jgi:hypothetical protein
MYSRTLVISSLLPASFLALLLLSGCSVNVNKDAEKGSKNVDINTPIGGIHVRKQADARATGLDIYPGAKPVDEEKDGDEKSADVNISTAFFGLKVVAQEYRSDDPPDKLINFYTSQLAKFGKVLHCRGSWQGGGHATMSKHDKDDKSKELKCEENSGDSVELKVGTEENQHIVAIKPEGKGSRFALVYVRVRGNDETI